MYCLKCGKEIEVGTVCLDCKANKREVKKEVRSARWKTAKPVLFKAFWITVTVMLLAYLIIFTLHWSGVFHDRCWGSHWGWHSYNDISIREAIYYHQFPQWVDQWVNKYIGPVVDWVASDNFQYSLALYNESQFESFLYCNWDYRDFETNKNVIFVILMIAITFVISVINTRINRKGKFSVVWFMIFVLSTIITLSSAGGFTSRAYLKLKPEAEKYEEMYYKSEEYAELIAEQNIKKAEDKALEIATESLKVLAKYPSTLRIRSHTVDWTSSTDFVLEVEYSAQNDWGLHKIDYYSQEFIYNPSKNTITVKY